VSSPIPIPGTGPKTVAVNLKVTIVYLRIGKDGEEEDCTMDMMLTPNVKYNKITGEVTDLRTVGTIPDDNAVAVIGARVKLVTPPTLPDPVWRVNLKPSQQYVRLDYLETLTPMAPNLGVPYPERE